MSGWKSVGVEEASRLEQELARELSAEHALHGRIVRAVARRGDRDEFAYEVTPGGLCVVHLTWSSEPDGRWPRFAFVERLPED